MNWRGHRRRRGEVPDRAAILLAPALLALLLLPAQLHAGTSPQCGQPVSAGSTPTAADALAILQSAVGGDPCSKRLCLCDVNGDSAITTNDALRTLRAAVGLPVALLCACDGCADTAACLACTSFEFSSTEGSELDIGWTGLGHNQPWFEGSMFTADVLRRCAANGEPCKTDAGCPSGSECVPTCDCVTDTTCELTGPTHQKRCIFGLAACEDEDDCDGGGNHCVSPLGPQLPSFAGGRGECTFYYFDNDLRGSVNLASGEFEWAARLKRYSLIPEAHVAPPCPRCGSPEQDPRIGDVFVCEGGTSHGQSCTVHAVHPDFGGMSYDCARNAPDSSPNPVSLGEVTFTTQAVARTAQFPCSGIFTQSHPSRGNGICVDDSSTCTTNADCKRCLEDPSRACTTNEDCEAQGPCSTAPDQPVTCGYWCHCGFCGDDPDLPCFDDSQCPDATACVVGTGLISNSPQRQPNHCWEDSFLCGADESERCESSFLGHCDLQPNTHCETNKDCAPGQGGDCLYEKLPCFESTIARTGEVTAIGHGTLTATGVALTCAPAAGPGDYTGPAAFSLKTHVTTCACGDNQVGCGEECDDGNVANSDGCNELCKEE